MTAADSPEPGAVPFWRRALPFAIAVSLIAYVMSRLDFGAFVDALRATNYFAFVGFTLAFNAALLGADALATTHVYRRTVAPVRYLDLVMIRGASYLPSAVNHHVGQAWLTYFLSKAYGAPLWRVAGATLLVYATTFAALYLFLLVGWLLGSSDASWVTQAVVAIAALGLGYLLVIWRKPKALHDRPITAPLVEVGVRGHLAAVVFRLPHVLVQFFGAWIPFSFFGVHVSFADALALLPILMFVVVLPISPQGLGTRDAVAAWLLASQEGATPEAIAATTLSWACALTLVQLAFWPIFVRRAYRLLGIERPSQGSTAASSD